MGIAALLFASSCASPALDHAASSDAETTLLLLGHWYQLDIVGGFQLSHRFELSFASDGTCTYYYIPKNPGESTGVTRGTWRLEGRSIVFDWERNSLGLDYRVDSGRIYQLDRHKLMIRYPEEAHGFQSFYRSYRESLFTVPKI